MSDIRTCWAFNKEGQRCEHPAGHTGNHIITAEWTDAECAIPTAQQVLSTPAAVYPPPPVLESQPLKCVACNHKHSGGTCKCGCYEEIA